MRLLTIVSLCALISILPSCVVKKNAIPLSPINTQVNFNYDDIEYIGDVTGTSTQSYLFGVIPIGGRRNHQGVFATNLGSAPLAINVSKRGINNALYDAMSSKPDADYVIPVSYKIETTIMPFGRKETLTIRAKAVKIRPKKPEPVRPEKKIEIKE